MDIVIDAGSAVAPYEQVRTRIAELAAEGVLAAGTRLPPVRALAAELGLAANTVARAYRELEQAGLVETHGRAGTLITARAAGTPAEAQRAARRYAEQATALGVSPQAALELVRAALRL
ncbi:GntR family transcriptional regulator [Amorphoplanes digitatis]|uniref:DNA-binding transcriptional regulator YhcF (GntR family) n=1 Tax=Actinoplanes digitatis TaxID=1868 RepID=A0A7W7HZ45_9ACTN|nr:GntR family transcriptional regulator [Actinoplanes digitatis]MBB4763361.1 DNA-binding transcriptional regulator YhcF (GntR family) [Actinoplanes digitatis]BFE72441.1 GntR family transcriptional regulator [Actinoplanes digitatis]GID92181.1 GntR family transcriptional regulator [Actinoplanes digitatis]